MAAPAAVSTAHLAAPARWVQGTQPLACGRNSRRAHGTGFRQRTHRPELPSSLRAGASSASSTVRDARLPARFAELRVPRCRPDPEGRGRQRGCSRCWRWWWSSSSPRVDGCSCRTEALRLEPGGAEPGAVVSTTEPVAPGRSRSPHVRTELTTAGKQGKSSGFRRTRAWGGTVRWSCNRSGVRAGRAATQWPLPRCPARRWCRAELSAFRPVMRTLLPRAAYLVSTASSAATVEASHTCAADRSITTSCGSPG